MTEPMTDDDESTDDPVVLATLVCSGRTLKRSENIQLVRDLLAIIDGQSAAARASPPVDPGPRPSPIPVESGPAGAVFLHTARWFTRADAAALAHEILRLTEVRVV